ncbi:MAG: response regulator [Bacteroidales bacterium]|nr:response regulator [Bacteroidales bacterium]
MRIKLLTIGLAALLCACSGSPKYKAPVVADDSIVISDRLSNQKVNAFAEDKDGHIWMATSRGLNKYTSSEFYQYFCTDDTLGLPDNQINVIHSALDGRLWVGTVNGLAVRSLQGQFQRIPFPGDSRSVSQILETREGDILFSNGSVLYKLDPATNDVRTVVREFYSFGSPSALIPGDGNLWVLTGNGYTLNCYSTQDFSLLRSLPLSQQTYHMCDAGNGELWLSGMGRLSILDIRSCQWKDLPAAIRACKPLMQRDIDILFNLEGQGILMNVIGQGFFLYSRTQESVYSQQEADFPLSVPKAEVRSLFQDSRGNLWFGTTDRGYHVSYHERGLFSGNKYLTDAFKDKDVTSLCVDKDGGLWITTLGDGLFRYDLETREIRSIAIGHLIPDSEVGYIRTSKVYCEPDGDLWFVFTDKMRVIRCVWDGRQLSPRDLVYAVSPLSLTTDDRGALWIGGFSGTLIRYDKRDKSSQTVSVVKPGEWTFVSDLLLEEPGKLLVPRFGMRPTYVNTYTLECTDRQVSADDLNATIRRSVVIPNRVLKDSGGNIWIGTLANGLLLDDKTTGHLCAIEGLPCPDVCSIEEDHHGNIWVSTMNGLAKYDRTVGRFVSYMEADGIAGDQFNDRASCVLPDGTLLFGGTDGLTCFNPLDAPAKRTVPLIFESLSIHNRLVAPSEDGPIDRVLSEKPDVTIRHNQNAFSISFTALDYAQYERIRYAYKLEGFDKDWVRIYTRHDAYFANLPAGNYKLRVRIANGSHTVSETEESLNIKVLPPWHATWWAKLLWFLLGCIVLGMAFTYYRHIRRVRKEAARRIWQVRRERERAEEAEKAEKELNKIQMNYFSNVAHEFRTPLTMIAGPAQQLSSSAGIQGQDRQLVDIIRRNTTWMLSLVNQLLDFNRIGNNKLQMKVAKMDIVEPLRDSASLFRFNAASKGVELATVGLEEPFTMWVDADKVQKVVMNLLSNALKFTPPGGKVTLSFDVISRAEAAARFPLTEADKDGQYACISVSDSGPGIPEDQLEKIFERFYQSEAGKKVTGSGIGLYYARALCTLHHGYIRAWNRPEGGALFGLVLPVSASSYTEEERTAETPQLPNHALAESITEDQPEEESAKRHIAVIDDDIDIANYLKVMLKPQYKVSLYFDAASALKGMEEDAPDLIISDVVMPGMDGYELCSRIKADLQLSHIPVVLVTAKVAVENQVQGLNKGADAYVTKPFQPAYLLALIKSLLDNREKLHRQLGSVTTTEDIAPEALSPRDAAFMKELYELMEKELANADLDIVQITEMMKISRTKFYYKVKGLTGENPSVFFKRYKLNRAADLLKEGKHNMSEIAWMTGFNTLSHFSTSFKKQFGVPPSEYLG